MGLPLRRIESGHPNEFPPGGTYITVCLYAASW
jgi:hypothetical protein